jgi:hypothetical protein
MGRRRRATLKGMWSTDSALAFLADHQPMPDDNQLDDVTIRQFNEVRMYFEANPDSRCVGLILGAIRSGSSGFGVYQLLDSLLAMHERGVVVQALRATLREARGPRCWALQFAMEYPDEAIRASALELVDDADEDIRWWARAYLEEHLPDGGTL